MQHNHADRGTFYVGCITCSFLRMFLRGDGFDKPFTAVGPGGTMVAPSEQEPAGESSVPDLEELGRIGQDTLGNNAATPSTSVDRAGQIVIGTVQPDSIVRITGTVVDPSRPDVFIPFFTTAPVDDDDVERRADIQGQEMGNKPTVMAERAAEALVSAYAEELAYVEWLLEIAAGGGNMAKVSLLAHLHEEHEGYKMSRGTVLRLAQMAHGLLHAIGRGHSDNEEHMVPPFSVELWKSRRRHLAQKRNSEYARQRRQARHLDRQASARAQREQVLLDSAHQLQRATEHAAGTIVPRIDMRRFPSPVVIGVGTKAPLSLATAQVEVNGTVFSGIGTALCRPGDTWSLEVGRKLSLGRALRTLGMAIEMDGHARDEERSQGHQVKNP